MRTLGRLLVLVIVVLSLLAGGRWLWRTLEWSDVAATIGGRIEGAFPSATYTAVDGQWLEFPLGADVIAVRVRTNATTDVYNPSGPDVVWWYAFEYQLLDPGGAVLREGTYNHRTRTSRFLDPYSGRQMTRSFLLDPGASPTDGRSMRMSLEGVEGAALLRLRPLQRDPALQKLLFRVYEQLRNPSRHLDYLWQRLGEAQRIRLARASVYGPDLLREQEQQNLLKRQWRAVGPLGVVGKAYGVERLYFPRDFVGDPLDENLMPKGLYISPVARAMIPLPEGEWTVTLTFALPGEPDAATSPAAVRVRWYGRGPGQRWEGRVSAAAGEQRLGETLGGGLLELIPDTPLVVSARVENAEGRFDVTPEPLRLRTFRAEPADPLVFRVDHVGASATPFRLDMRALLAAGEDEAAARAEYRLLDEAGRELTRGELVADLPLSNYDRPSAVARGVRASEPARFYFRLSADVASVRIVAGADLLFAAYSRPPDLARVVRVPEDYQAFPTDDLEQPAWFVLLPPDSQRLRASLRSESLVVQPRPPEDDPRLLAGQYDWELYSPEGDWRGRYLLVPREEGLPVRDQSRAAVFRELPAGSDVECRFIAPRAQREIEPLLVFTREDAAPMAVRIELDGEVVYSTRVSGRHGELQLPSLAPGRHLVRLEAAQPARWFLNYVDGDDQGYLRRMSMRLDADGLDFVYRKQVAETEILTGVFYAAADSRVELGVGVEHAIPLPSGPSPDWTFTDRVFDVRPDLDRRVPILNARGETLYGGQRFVVPLGTGLPPGDYRIRVEVGREAAGYLTLYRLIPGQPVTRGFFREEERSVN